MADVKVRNLADDIVEAFKARASSAGRSLEEELRQTLTEEIRRERREFIQRLAEDDRRLRAEYGVMPDSTPGIRADRERHG